MKEPLALTDNYSGDGFNLWPENPDLENRDNSSLLPPNLSEFELPHYRDSAPSAPIILLGAAAGLLCGMIGFYVSYQIIGIGIELTTAVALIALFIGLTVSSIGLSSLASSSALMSNLAFSCGLVVLSVLFFGLCIVSGALGATILMLLST